MTTENSNPPADDEVPPVARVFGRAVSEWVTYSFILFCVIALIFGSIVGGERDAQAERAMATLQALKEKAEKTAVSGSPLICNNALLSAEQLANEYLSLTVRKALIDPEDKSLGYGPALYVNVVEKEVSGDTWDTARRLMNLVKKAGEEEAQASEDAEATTESEPEDEKKPKNNLREVRKKAYGDKEEYLSYYILASKEALCTEDT